MTYPIGKQVIVRTYSAGVFLGVLETVDGEVVQLKDARRLWYWSGASSLSELATKGVSRPDQCKFPASVPDVTLRNWIEIIPATDAAVTSIQGVKPWTQH